MPLFYDNFGKYTQILIILLLLHSEINCGRCWNESYHLTSNSLPHYLVKGKCSTAQLFIHMCTGQNDMHSVKCLTYLFILSVLVLFSECCCNHLTLAQYFASSPAKCFPQHWIRRHWLIGASTDTLHTWLEARMLAKSIQFRQMLKLICIPMWMETCISHKCRLFIMDLPTLLNWITAPEVCIHMNIQI